MLLRLKSMILFKLKIDCDGFLHKHREVFYSDTGEVVLYYHTSVLCDFVLNYFLKSISYRLYSKFKNGLNVEIPNDLLYVHPG